MIHIFQVPGDIRNYDEKTFIIEGKRTKSLLCSDALRKRPDVLERYFGETDGIELTFFIPESLFSKDMLEILNQKLGEFEYTVIPSLGEYSVGGRKVRYMGSVEAISTAIFLHLLKLRPEKLVIDVSTGFNIYPISMLEAVKRYVTYKKLERVIQGNSGVKAFAAFPPPILRDVDEYPVEIQPVDAKAFFALPNADVDKIAKDKRFGEKIGEIGRRYGKLKKEFRRIFDELKIGLNAIRLNVPLAFYELLEMNEDLERVEREMIDFISEYLEPVRSEKIVERIPIDGVNVANIFYSLALYRSIRNFKNTLHDPELREILDAFSKVYKALGMRVNEYFLQRDTDDILNHSDKLSEGERRILGILKHGRLRGSGSEPRNFFAHSGFIEEHTLVWRVGDKVYVSWVEDKKNVFKNWLLNP
ncbi:TM1812 family CRISPR-associated protein [Archaeoglobus sp.]